MSLNDDLEHLVGSLITMVLSRSEYQAILRSQTLIDSDYLPSPNFVDAGYPDDLITLFGSTTSEDNITLPGSTKKHINTLFRTQSRACLKLYLGLIALKTVASGGKRWVLVDKPAASSAYALFVIAIVYKYSYSLLAALEPVAVKTMSRFVQANVSLDEATEKTGMAWEPRTIIALLAATFAGSQAHLLPRKARAYAAVYAVVRATEAVYKHMVDLGALTIKAPISWPLAAIAYSQLTSALINDPSLNGPLINRGLFYLSDRLLPASSPAHDYGVNITTTRASRVPDAAAVAFHKSVVRGSLSLAGPLAPSQSKLREIVSGFLSSDRRRLLVRKLVTKYTVVAGAAFVLFFAQALRTSYPKPTDEKDDYDSLEYIPVVIWMRRVVRSMLRATAAANVVVLPTFVFWTAYHQTPWFQHKPRVLGLLAGLLMAGSGSAVGPVRSFIIRAGIMSGLNQMVKRRTVKPVKGQGVWVFAVAFGILMATFERDPAAVESPMLRKILNWIRTGEFVDPSEDLKLG